MVLSDKSNMAFLISKSSKKAAVKRCGKVLISIKPIFFPFDAV